MIEGEKLERERTHRFVVRFAFVLTGLLLIVFFTLSQLFAWGQVSDLKDEVNDLRTQQNTRSTKSDCLALYRNDVTVAIGVALAANNELFVAVATQSPIEQTPEQEAEFLKQLGIDLQEATTPLVAASQALEEYDKIDPPPNRCPHPNAPSIGDD